MKSVEINDLLSYHFYGNLKVKDGVKVFVDGVAAEKDNAYEYTLKCVKDDKVYDLTSFGKEAGFYIENENSVLFCGNRKNIEKSTSLYRLALNGGEAKEIARFDKPGMNVLGYLNENTLVLMTKEKLVEEKKKQAKYQTEDAAIKAVEAVDECVGKVVKAIKDKKANLLITADHGNDPTTPSTDHSREYTPILVYGKQIKSNTNLGIRKTYADISATILDLFNLSKLENGTSFKNEILK